MLLELALLVVVERVQRVGRDHRVGVVLHLEIVRREVQRPHRVPDAERQAREAEDGGDAREQPGAPAPERA